MGLLLTRRWIGQKVVEILATEDDVVIDFIFGMLEENRFVAPPPHPWLSVVDCGCPKNAKK